MGVDAGIYAKNSKKYYWFDRLYNIHAYFDHLDYDEKFKQFDEIYSNKRREGLTKGELIPFLEANLAAWESGSEDQKYHGFWCRSLIAFVNEHPNDTFVILDDHGDFDEIIKLEKEYEEVPEHEYEAP